MLFKKEMFLWESKAHSLILFISSCWEDIMNVKDTFDGICHKHKASGSSALSVEKQQQKQS